MKLIDVIYHFKDIERARLLMQELLPTVDFDQIDVYLRETLDTESEVAFFDAEDIPNDVYIEVGGVKYVNLFPLYLTQEIIEDFGKSEDGRLSDVEIAKKLLEFREKDA